MHKLSPDTTQPQSNTTAKCKHNRHKMDLKLLTITPAILLIALATHVSQSSSLTRPQPSSADSTTALTDSQVTVRTSSGLLNGSKHALNIGSSSIYKFLAVPYAEPPTGARRFRKPVELSASQQKQVVDATKFGKTCPQFRHLTRFISPLLNVDPEHQISEDCLKLNLFVPTNVGQLDSENHLEPNKQLPVIVFLPGEGFNYADARQFDGSYLAHKTQSIVVTVQYRVGVFGFLQAPKLNITGNMGVHDQIMALDWVRGNIQAFGGDPDRVTLMGRFTGSMSISAMITAPNQDLLMRNGRLLFNRVILLSGIAVNDWAINPQLEQRMEEIEQRLIEEGLCSPSELQTDACLQKMPVHELLRVSGYEWRLARDNQLVGPMSPPDAIERNMLPSQLESVMIGETASEGTICMYRHLLNTKNNYAQLIEENKLTSEDLNEIIRDDLLTYFGYNITRAIESTFGSMIEDSSSNEGLAAESAGKLRDKYLNACSSFMVKSHSNRFKRNILTRNYLASTRMNSSKKPVDVFHYELKYKPTFSLAPDYVKTAAHGDDVPLIFGLIYNQQRRDINEADLLMTRKMMSYVGNFVHGNNPLLNQHPSIDSKHEADSVSTISMDDNETGPSADNNLVLPNLPRRNWSTEGQVHLVELNEIDSSEIRSAQARVQNQSEAIPEQSLKQSRGRVFLVVNQVPPSQSEALFEIQTNQLTAMQAEDSGIPITRSQRLVELHRRQTLEQVNEAGARRAVSSPQGQQAALNSLGDSSFMTMLLFSSCIVIFTLMSLCLGLCLIIFRNHMKANTNKPQMQPFSNSSSSSCDICDQTHRTVLDDDSKANRAFGNMLVKLVNHHDSNPLPASASASGDGLSTASRQAQQAQVHQSQNHRHHTHT